MDSKEEGGGWNCARDGGDFKVKRFFGNVSVG